VADCPGLTVAAVTAPGEIEKSFPVPESGTLCGLPGASSVIVRLPLRLPPAPGLKVTSIVQFPPAATAVFVLTAERYFQEAGAVGPEPLHSPETGAANATMSGAGSKSPFRIPWAGWKDILWRVYASVNDNRLLAVAGGVAFYSLLAIFPAVAAFVSLYGLVADASTIDAHLSLAAGVFPASAVELLHEQITRIAAKSDAGLGLGFLTGLAVALWSANAGMKAIIDALNVVYDEKEKRSFVKLNLRRHPFAHDCAWRRCHRADGLFRFRPFVAS